MSWKAIRARLARLDNLRADQQLDRTRVDPSTLSHEEWEALALLRQFENAGERSRMAGAIPGTSALAGRRPPPPRSRASPIHLADQRRDENLRP